MSIAQQNAINEMAEEIALLKRRVELLESIVDDSDPGDEHVIQPPKRRGRPPKQATA